MANKIPQLLGTMSKLTFVTILARTTLLKRSAQLCLVAACVDVGSLGVCVGRGNKCRGSRFALAAVQLPVGWWLLLLLLLLLFPDVVQNQRAYRIHQGRHKALRRRRV
jgi:hypothetical protein